MYLLTWLTPSLHIFLILILVNSDVSENQLLNHYLNFLNESQPPSGEEPVSLLMIHYHSRESSPVLWSLPSASPCALTLQASPLTRRSSSALGSFNIGGLLQGSFLMSLNDPSIFLPWSLSKSGWSSSLLL